MARGRGGGPPWPLGLVVMLAGMALAIPFVVRAVTTVTDTVSDPVHATPVHLTQELDAGRYVVYERTGETRRVGPVARGDLRAPTIVPANVTVVGADGETIGTTFTALNETTSRGTDVFIGVVTFEVDVPGTYEIDVDGGGQQVILARSIGDRFGSLGGVFLMALGGGLLFLTGGVLLVLAIARGGRGDEAEVASVAAGWYPDPSGVPGRRYWDGDRWTDHTAP